MYDFDPKKDYYAILGVDEKASEDDIKKAFRAWAVKHHPDRKWGDKAKFQAINEAHGILSDPKKRQQYDMMRQGGGNPFGGGGGFGGFGWGSQVDFGGVDLGDLLGGMFGGGFGSTSAQRQETQAGEDIRARITISFEEGFLGVKKTIKYRRQEVMAGVKAETCKTCWGRGVVAQNRQTPFGVMQVQAHCPECHGTGIIVTKDGEKVANDGLHGVDQTLDVNVPAGIKDGVFLKYGGKGHESPTHESGDLYVKIDITPSSVRERRGDDLVVKAPVRIFDLVLGWDIQVPHPAGKVTVKVPKGTQVTDTISVGGKGFAKTSSGILGSKAGNMIVIPELSIPKRLSKEEEKVRKSLQDK